MTGIPRLTAAERKHFTTLPVGAKRGQCADWGFEPAAGTLDERLDILIRRFGGTIKMPRLTADEWTELRRCTVSL